MGTGKEGWLLWQLRAAVFPVEQHAKDEAENQTDDANASAIHNGRELLPKRTDGVKSLMYLARHTRRVKRLRGLGDIAPLPGQAPPSVLSNLWDDFVGLFTGKTEAADLYYLTSPGAADAAFVNGNLDLGQQIQNAFQGNPTEQEISQAITPGIYVGANAPPGNSSLYAQVAAANAPLLAPYAGTPDLTPVSTSTYWIIGIFAGLVVLGIAVSK